jgi:hypothetical protein
MIAAAAGTRSGGPAVKGLFRQQPLLKRLTYQHCGLFQRTLEKTGAILAAPGPGHL